MSQSVSAEDLYFAKQEFERKKHLEAEKHKHLKTQEKKNLKELHFMRCPKCGMELIEIDYKSIKVDRCSECDGIWLDSGELDSVIKMEKGAQGKFFGLFGK